MFIFHSTVYGQPQHGPVYKFYSSSGQFSGTGHLVLSWAQKMYLSGGKRTEKAKVKMVPRAKGRLLRTKVRPHVQTEQSNRTRCGLCNVKNSNNVGSIKTFVLCTTCNVPLCNDAKVFRISCWHEWHNEKDLYQRINCRMVPRRR